MTAASVEQHDLMCRMDLLLLEDDKPNEFLKVPMWNGGDIPGEAEQIVGGTGVDRRDNRNMKREGARERRCWNCSRRDETH